eukprot:SAG25_NODE_1680_length_2563_cov_65.625000_3_plen_305_part_00
MTIMTDTTGGAARRRVGPQRCARVREPHSLELSPSPCGIMAATERAAAEVLSVQCMACPEAAAPLEQWTYSIAAQPGAGEVDVAITHCGVCGSDVHQLDDAWGAACFPLVPGHEIVGLVTQVGDGVQHLEVGQRVGIGCQRSHCGSCDNCSAKLEQLCPKITKTYAGPDADKGGFAHYIRYNATWVFPVPDGIASELAAPLLCAGITTYAPLRRHCKAGTAVGVIGIGGLGHIAIQFARAMGCVVTAISTSASKREEARGFGAETLLVSSDPAAMAQARGSLDFILNTASGVHGASWDKYGLSM